MIDRRYFLGVAAALAATPSFAQPSPLKGSWTGVLAVGSASLRLKLEIGDGTAILYSLDQGAEPIPATVVSLTPERIALEFPQLQARYTGTLAGPDRIEGELFQGQGLPLVFLRGDAGLAVAPVQPLTDAGLEALRQGAGVPAMAVAARAGTGPIRDWVTGERLAGSGVRATRQDLWHLGSITKSMTATLIGRLVDAGKVRWDDTVGRVLGAAAPNMRSEYRAVTYRHLLSHRSGLQANLALSDMIAFSRELDDPRQERIAHVNKALAQAPVGPAGQTFTYSNNGYIVAGAMLEQVLGKPWEALIREHLFAPLNLDSAGIGAPGRAGVPIQPVGHAAGPTGALMPFPVGSPVTDNPAVVGPAGRVHMSMADAVTYLGAHRDRSSLLKPETWRTLHTAPFGGDYAMGWVLRDGGLWHNGSNTLWYAEVAVDFAGGRVAAAAANAVRPGVEAGVAKALAGGLAAAAAIG